MDQIVIQDLTVYAKHGVYSEENVLGQQFLVSVTLDTDLSVAGRTDNLNDSIDYGTVCHFVTDFMQAHTFKLIETAAQRLAEQILLQYPKIKKIRVKVKKPWAPIGLPIKTVSVSVERSRHVAYIALGSNMGDREGYIRKGIAALDALDTCRVCEVSKLIETEPYGGVRQDKFLNGALRLDTVLSPHQLLDELHTIEADAGRRRDVHWGPRTLDLDILFYDDDVISTPGLSVPHPDMQNRLFVLGPMNEIAPWLRHPLFKMTIRQLFGQLEQSGAGTPEKIRKPEETGAAEAAKESGVTEE